VLFCVHAFDEVESTQDVAKSFPPYSIILTSKQTHGRGRNGKKWQSQEGNLFSTFVLPGDRDPFQAHTIFLKSIKKVLSKWIPLERISIKPPNDILIDAKKISGILVEVEDEKILLGFGLNIVSAPFVDQPTTCLRDLCVKATIHTIIFELTQVFY
jgi:BirA family biotin operon repressor/biotin-[acetyl-CoA-carboxylase] ligase